MNTKLRLWCWVAFSVATFACDPSSQSTQADAGQSQQSKSTIKVRTDDALERNKDAARQSGLHMADANFISDASNGGLLEIEMGKVALTKAASAKVKEFARMMIADHTKAHEELRVLTTQKNIDLPVQSPVKISENISAIQKFDGKDFDREYMRAMVKDHKIMTEVFQSEAHDGRDALIKAYAAKTLPNLMHHLKMAETLSASVGDKSTGKP